MAGHSKWANIKIRKGAQDVKRGKAFTKLIREITTAARIGGAEPAFNPRLRSAILAARGQNLPKETMDKAIKRGAGAEEGTDFKEVRFEGYGPAGVAIIVDTLSDNNNRTVADVRHIFSKYGGNMGSSGCVAYLFDKKGQIIFQGEKEESLLEAALEAGAEDMLVNGDECEVITSPETFEAVREALAANGFAKPLSAEITMRPQTTVTLEERSAMTMLKLLDMLEDNDDVQKVYANFDIPDEIMERLGNG